MTDFIFAFDNEDEDIGSFVQGCREDLEDFFRELTHNPTYIDSRSLNAVNIQMRTEKLDSFVFAAYSHGHNNMLATRNSSYISVDLNVSTFKNAFFYTVSCLTGKELGVKLIENGCRCYFGYKTTFSCWLGYAQFSICANFGLIKFIEGQKTMDVFNLMIENYNSQIDSLFPTDFLQASLLRENRDGLVRIGEDFSIAEM